MEIEQPTSNFQKTPPTMILAPDIETAIGKTYSSNYRLQSSGEITQLLKKIVAKSYSLVDSLSGFTSRLLLNFPSDFNFPELCEILNFLKSQGIIKQTIFNQIRYNDAPFFYKLDLMPNNEKIITDGKVKVLEKPIGHGFGKNIETVFSKAIGELLERYFLTIYQKKKLMRGSCKDLKNKKLPILDLNLLAGFSNEQKKNNPKFQFDEESIFYWEKAKRFLTRETVYLPAQLIYWAYVHNELEPYLAEGNTNGAGGFFTKEGAILSGLYELIQRDSFLIYWLNKVIPKRIDPETVPNKDFQNLLRESKRYGFEVHCLNITADTGVPTFAVALIDSFGQNPYFCLAAGCQSDPARALFRGLEEAWSVYYWMRPKPAFPTLSQDYRPFQNNISQDERLRLWSNPEMSEHFKFLISGQKEAFADIKFNYPKEFRSQKEELDFLVKRVESLGPGYEVYYYQAQHPSLTAVGYYSAQVVVPQFIPLYLNETLAPLGSRRIKEVPAKLGFKAANNINPLPHPFP